MLILEMEDDASRVFRCVTILLVLRMKVRSISKAKLQKKACGATKVRRTNKKEKPESGKAG